MDLTRLRTQLQTAEARKLVAYRDSEGYWTGGVGHLLDQKHDWTGVVFTDRQVDIWLDSDTDAAVAAAQRLTEWQYLDTDARQNAVVELCFNLGSAKWKLFAHARMAITHKDWQTAHDQLLDSKWAKQVRPTRANRLANYLLLGEF